MYVSTTAELEGDAKDNILFKLRISIYPKVIKLFLTVKIISKLNMQRRVRRPRSPDDANVVIHVAVLQRTAKKCTMNYNTRAGPLFYSVNLLFSDATIAIAVFLNS